HDKKVDRQTDSEIGAHGGVHRNQSDLQRVIKIGVVGDGAIEHRLAVFMFTNLQIGRVYRALDEIAGRVDHEKLQTAALDLTAEQKGNVVLNVRRGQRLAFDVLHFCYRAPDPLRGLKHRRRVHQRFGLAGLSVLYALGQCRTNRLADREVARGGKRHEALTRLRVDVQFAKRGNIVETCVGARIGNHHEPGANENSAAIGHRVK